MPEPRTPEEDRQGPDKSRLILWAVAGGIGLIFIGQGVWGLLTQ
ncbi:hypothetical protein [Mycetocola spongiae]|nr:hypothetical protein [Mycetocola spongiae]